MNLPNAFTVDLEDWYQGLTSTNRSLAAWPSFPGRVLPATRSLLALLQAGGVKATFFVLGCVAEQHPDLIAEIAAAGHEIAVHGHTHRFVNRLTPAEFGRELDLALEAIGRVTGQAPLGHRAPYFSIDRRSTWALDVLQSRGFRYDSSIFPAASLLYGYAGAPRGPHVVGPAGALAEFPVSTVKVGRKVLPFGGGFYVRALPYPLVRWAARRVRQEGLPLVFYLHPWELDLDQPRIRVTARERVTHYGGRVTLRSKLERLFADHAFGPLADLLAQAGSVSPAPALAGTWE